MRTAGEKYAQEDVEELFKTRRKLDGAGVDDPLTATSESLVSYLQGAAQRPSSSSGKLRTAAIVLDLHDRFFPERTLVNPAEGTGSALALLGAATNGFASDDAVSVDQRAVLRACSARIDEILSNQVEWQVTWEEATRLGTDLEFSFGIETRRATTLWGALTALGSGAGAVRLGGDPQRITDELKDVSVAARETPPEVFKNAGERVVRGKPGSANSEGGIAEAVARKQDDPRRDDAQAQAKQLTVWFGTNRQQRVLSDTSSPFGNKLAGDLAYGFCTVNIPRPDTPVGGNQPLIPSFWVRVGRRTGAARVEQVFRFADGADFLAHFRDELTQTPEDRTALVFVHGFATSFAAAALTAARISWSIKHKGPTAMFTWASHGDKLRYLDDERVVEQSRAHLVEFLATLTADAGLEAVDLVVHSLGNRLLLRSLDDWFSSAPPTSPPLRHVYLGAPDIDTSEYHSGRATYANAASKITMYNSDRDAALLMSQILHRGRSRAGQSPPLATSPLIDTIDTSSVDRSRMRHSAVIDEPSVRADIFSIQSGLHDPARRANLEGANSSHTPDYWRFER